MLHRTAPHPSSQLGLAATGLHPDRIPRDAPSNRIVPANQPVRELEPGEHRQRLGKLARVNTTCRLLQRKRLWRHPTTRTTTTTARIVRNSIDVRIGTATKTTSGRDI